MSISRGQTHTYARHKQSCDLFSPVQVLPSLKALTALNVSSNQEVGGVVHALVSALPLKQMKHLPLNSCSLNEESFTALGTHTHTLSEVFSSSGLLLPSLSSWDDLCSFHQAPPHVSSLRVCLSSGSALPVQCGCFLVQSGWRPSGVAAGCFAAIGGLGAPTQQLCSHHR